MKFFGKLFLYSWGVYMICVPFRLFSFRWSMIVEGLTYAILFYWMLKKGESKGIWKTIFPLLTGLLWLELPMRILFYTSSRISLMTLLCTLWAVGTTVFFYQYKSKVIGLVGLAIWFCGVTVGQKNWQEYVSYGILPDQSFLNISAYVLKEKNRNVHIRDFGKKYLLLDFWSLHCGVCFEKFPKLQKLSDYYENNPDVTVISVFLTDSKRKETLDKAEEIIKKRNCSFTVCSMEWDDPMLEYCGVDGVPTVLILDEQRNVIFRGSIEFADNKLKQLLNE